MLCGEFVGCQPLTYRLRRRFSPDTRAERTPSASTSVYKGRSSVCVNRNGPFEGNVSIDGMRVAGSYAGFTVSVRWRSLETRAVIRACCLGPPGWNSRRRPSVGCPRGGTRAILYALGEHPSLRAPASERRADTHCGSDRVRHHVGHRGHPLGVNRLGALEGGSVARREADGQACSLHR